jgi:hypothetical protein
MRISFCFSENGLLQGWFVIPGSKMKDWRLVKAIIDQDVWITARDVQN